MALEEKNKSKKMKAKKKKKKHGTRKQACGIVLKSDKRDFTLKLGREIKEGNFILIREQSDKRI